MALGPRFRGDERRSQLKRHAGRPQHHADRLLPEPLLVGLGDLGEARHVLRLAGQYDHHHLARLAHDPVAVRVAPLPASVVDRQAIRKARRDLAVEEVEKLSLTYREAIADLAPE